MFKILNKYGFHKDTKLIMTLLARNEEDVIRDNIEFHLNHGVDFIIATDNNSEDSTRDIFVEYKKKGKLFLIDEPGRDKSQAVWNNRMTKIAVDEYGADLIFHCDADEFWFPKKGDLKTELMASTADVLSVDLVNVLLEDKGGGESFPEDAKYAVVKTIATGNFEEDSKKENLYFFPYPPKVMFRTNKRILEVGHGNHNIINGGEDIEIKKSQNIDIFHFPMRGKKRFYQKASEAGKAIEKNTLLGKDSSFHIRRWYKAFNEGTLNSEYKMLVISKKEADRRKEDGMIKEIDFNKLLRTKK